MTDEEIQALIDEATAAYHKLVLGFSRVSIRAQDGRTITYASADQPTLFAYIQSLRALLSGAPKRSRYFRMTQSGNGL